jgi:hypothetical protein
LNNSGVYFKIIGRLKIQEGIKMAKLTVDFSEIKGKIKPMHSVNNGPIEGPWELETVSLFKEAGIPEVFVQDNQSASKKGVLRGLHFQINFPQDKLVRVVNGEVFDERKYGKCHLTFIRKEK